MKKQYTLSMHWGEADWEDVDIRPFLSVSTEEMAKHICASLNQHARGLLSHNPPILASDYADAASVLLGMEITSDMTFEYEETFTAESLENLTRVTARDLFGPDSGYLFTRISDLNAYLTEFRKDFSPGELEEFERELVWLRYIARFWVSLEALPYDAETGCILQDWHNFQAGTPRSEIWEWMEERFGVSIKKNFL